MTKRLLIIALGALLCSLGAAAQSVTVVLKDGTQHKFGTDYVKEIYFQEQQQSGDIQISGVETNPYSGGNVGITFNMQDGASLCLDVYGPVTATYLMPGTYIVGGTAEFMIDTAPNYTYYQKEGAKTGVASGSMTVTNDEAVYTLAVDMTLTDGVKVQGSWTGELDKYSRYIKKTISAAKYNDNPGAPGEFYIKFNDADWTTECAIDFFAEASDTELAEGTYTYSAEESPMTFGPRSYVDFYGPYSTNRVKEGIITVKKEGENHSIVMNLEFEDTRIATLSFSGNISGTPTFENTAAAPKPAMRRSAATLTTIRTR